MLELSHSKSKENAMRKFKQIVYSLIFMFVSTGIIHGTELQEGFLGINWGAHISELTGLSEVSEIKRAMSVIIGTRKSLTPCLASIPPMLFSDFSRINFLLHILR